MSLPTRQELEPLFLAVEYVAMLPDGDLALRIGRYDADAERRIVAATACRRGWQLVTPCNPGAVRASDDANRLALAEFHLALRDWGGAWHASLSRATPDWPEEAGALIVDAEPAWVHALAARFGQRAYVAATLGEAPALVWVAAQAGG